MKEFLCQESYYCKPLTGLKMSCKFVLGRDMIVFTSGDLKPEY